MSPSTASNGAQRRRRQWVSIYRDFTTSATTNLTVNWSAILKIIDIDCNYFEINDSSAAYFPCIYLTLLCYRQNLLAYLIHFCIATRVSNDVHTHCRKFNRVDDFRNNKNAFDSNVNHPRKSISLFLNELNLTSTLISDLDLINDL